MTKVQMRFRLARPLDDAQLGQVAAAHSIYGIHRITLSHALDELVVEYDATRLRPAEVERALLGAGLAVVAQAST